MKEKILAIIEWLAARYIKRHDIRLVVVVGSVGKTSTKTAIAEVLRQKYKVRAHTGNHNTHFSVPLAIVGVEYPENVHLPFAWFKVIVTMAVKIYGKRDTQIVVQELGTDKPGDLSQFAKYLTPDIAVVTAVSPEHMEFFKTLEEVAKEELSVAKYSKLTIVNRDDVSEDFAKYAETTSIDTYGTSGVAEYKYVIDDAVAGEGFNGTLITPEFGEQKVVLRLVGEHSIRAAVAATLVGIRMGLSSQEVIKGLQNLRPVAGRMQILRGVEGSTILDDTYNSSPLAVAAALQTLYNFSTPQRIAILGSMNELGETSAEAHQEVGKLCDPALLSWVVTIGGEAEKYLATAAKARGCQVKSFKSPYDAGAFVRKVIEPGAVVLAKGSQNGVFAEEALKILLHSTAEEASLVRQSKAWLDKKQAQFF